MNRQFLGGTQDVRGKAALHHLNQKADQVRQGGVVEITLRADSKARITASDLMDWASRNGFRIKQAAIGFAVEDVCATLDRMAMQVRKNYVFDCKFAPNSLVTTMDLHNWAKENGFAIDEINGTTFRVGKYGKVAA